MWDTIARRWLDLLFWWLPRRSGGRLPEEARGRAPGVSEPPAGREEGVEQQVEVPEEEVGPDDLTVLKGIGPAVQAKLRSLGIATFRDLAAADPDALTERLKGAQPVSKARVRGWTEAARERTGARG